MQPAEETVLPGMAPCHFLASFLGATMFMFTELAVSSLKKGLVSLPVHLSIAISLGAAEPRGAPLQQFISSMLSALLLASQVTGYGKLPARYSPACSHTRSPPLDHPSQASAALQ